MITYLRYYRNQKKMTQEQLAEKADLSSAYISQIESGYRSVGKRATTKIAAALDVPICALLEESQENPLKDSRIAEALSDCTPQELNIICDTILSLKQTLRTNSTPSN